MDRWRRKSDKCNQEFGRTDYNNNYYNNPYRKPPVGGNPNWQPSVPYWEKRFVSLVGSFSWKKFLEAKEFTHLYDNVLKWDDSAGKEAFHTAKDTFHAKFHGLPCDDAFHDPDLYIDKIDWNADIDHGLIKDFDNEYVVHDDGSPREPVVIFDNMLPDPYKDYSPYGWGDSDDVKKDQSAVNWDDCIDHGKIIWDSCNDNNAWWDWNENDNDNKEGDQGNNNNNNYVCNNMNNRSFHGNNKRRNNGNWRKSTGQRYESQNGHGSAFQGRGSQRVRVHQ
ncbi:uncharacterized protein LOC143560431 [Bidens hawaiensis]|uniref:uncharacterized protein LOC143560431 n=1 Tax=Bidens hawaiensis TaxID=980011 RepID=UPI004049F39E